MVQKGNGLFPGRIERGPGSGFPRPGWPEKQAGRLLPLLLFCRSNRTALDLQQGGKFLERGPGYLLPETLQQLHLARNRV